MVLFEDVLGWFYQDSIKNQIKFNSFGVFEDVLGWFYLRMYWVGFIRIP